MRETIRRNVRPSTLSSWIVAASLIVATVPISAVAPAAATPTASGTQALDSLRAHRYSSAALSVPAEGLTFSRDTASWTLSSGEIRLQEAVDGIVTGLVFEGQGTFSLGIPDPIELRHLRRLTGEAALEDFEVSFTELVLRTTEPRALDWLPAAPDGGYSENELARDRHEHWLIKRFLDVDARVVAGLHMPGDLFFHAGMHTEAHDWLTYTYDDLGQEEISLSKFQPMNEYTERWLSLDRPEDRDGSGRPNGVPRWPIDIEHVVVSADVTGHTIRGRQGFSGVPLVDGRFNAKLRFKPTRPGLRALPLSLTPLARVESVVDAAGRELPFIRDPIGDRSSGLDDRWFDDSLVVLLPAPLEAGETTELQITYRRELAGFVSGRNWYPGLPLAFEDLHTSELRITAGEKTQVRGIGALRDKIAGDDDVVTWVWAMEKPTKMAGFSYADRFIEQTIELEGVPKVVSFSPPVSNRAKKMVRNVGVDIANSLRFFQWLFDSRLPVDTIQATGIPSGHGQAFEGFLHLSEVTFRSESTNTAELFRAHEVAHQWWGHELGWKSYRDQWLSEAFAEYSSMMFLEATTKNGPQIFEDVLQAYTDLLTGKRIANFNRFVRPGLSDLDNDHLARLGPIGLGWRASTCEMPQGYVVQNYYKGPLVLHMLRQLLKRPGEGDGLFVTVLRDFVATHRGGAPSTEDFRRVLEKHAGGDWSWFFDQWVYGTAIPTYAWDYRISEKDGKPMLEVTVKQEDVPEGFIMSVPVRLEFAGGQGGVVKLTVKQAEETFRFPLPRKPKKVIFNPDFSVLAKVNKG